jgi:acyl-coenzyme A thioesterase PaaI-like protein
VIFLEADLKDDAGKLIATASSTVMIAQMKR